MQSHKCSKCGYLTSSKLYNCKNCNAQLTNLNNSQNNNNAIANPQVFEPQDILNNPMARRVYGVIVILSGIGFFAMNWYEGRFSPITTFLGPLLFILGLALVFVPMPNCLFGGELKEVPIKWWFILLFLFGSASLMGYLNVSLIPSCVNKVK
jgi:hypothetical protein